ncbi:NADP-dependent oxidoreductase [Kitasatospora sp. NPDC050543]|uniref:NADP-dependent oxidoreductase n=1 Tax=Kitasatospora sp. NPDC050543 TaxID=3364054 RepID=UPI0037B8DFCE
MTTSTTTTTKAVAFSEFGSADVLHAIEIGLPSPGPGQVRIAVRAIGVNPLDSKVRRGAMKEMFPVTFPHVPGYEAAGVVEAVGAGVTDVRAGDDVVGPTIGGAYAEHALLDAQRLAVKPASLSWEQAAALPVALETSWRALEALAVPAGGTLLVHGAAGGVGTVLLQLARARGIRVIGTAGEGNHAHLRRLGAVPVAYGEGLADRVRAVAPEGIDAALDAAGRDEAVTASIELTGGTERVLCIAEMEVAERYGVRFSAGDPGGAARSRTALLAAFELHAGDGLLVPIHRALPLARASEAQRLSEHGHLAGKIVLTVG